MSSRRDFLAFLAGSPLLALGGVDLSHVADLLSGSTRDQARALDLVDRATQGSDIKSAAEALNVFDFEPVAQKRVPIAHWAYLMGGSDDDATIRANREGFSRYELRMRRLVDVSRIDTSITLFGKQWRTPIVVNPVASNKAFHPDGEIAVAHAAKVRGNLLVQSTLTTSSYEDVSAARGEPVWFQLYPRQDWNQTLQMIKRVEKAGCPAIVLTVDLLGGSNRETMLRGQHLDTRDCASCHLGGNPAPGITGRVDGRDNRRKPMLRDFAPGTPIREVGTPTWEFVKRMKDATPMRVLLKGIVTREDAELAMQHGVDGLFVSNHGGRAENSLRPAIACVAEVVAGVAGRVPVIVDGGFRRGTDIFKALALGATAAGIGRPYIWGLASFGQEGVEVVLALLQRELEMVMRQAGAVNVTRITPSHIVERRA